MLSHFSHVRLCATHRWQPTRLPRPWDSPGKNTGVGCHFLLQCMKVKSEVKSFSRVRLLATPRIAKRLLHRWDFPSKSTGVGCHCLLWEKWYRWSYLQRRNRNTDIQNTCMGTKGFPGGSYGKESSHNVGNLGLIPGESPGEGNGYPPQYSSLKNFMDRGAWRATVHGVPNSRARLRD